MGRPRAEVLHELGARTGVPDLRALAAVLIQADKFGSSVAQALRTQSDSMRTRRRQLAEEKAAKTAVKLIFPLVLFIFPGIFVVLVGPAAITMVRQMFPHDGRVADSRRKPIPARPAAFVTANGPAAGGLRPCGASQPPQSALSARPPARCWALKTPGRAHDDWPKDSTDSRPRPIWTRHPAELCCPGRRPGTPGRRAKVPPPKEPAMNAPASRRSFFRDIGLGSLGRPRPAECSHAAAAAPPDEKILGEAGVKTSQRPKGVWKPVSDRKIRVGIVGYGVCQFGAAFGFQDHPNVTVAAVSDLFPDRCAGLAKACRCAKTYPSLEELVKDDTIEAVFVATDAPSHARHCIEVLKHGKHVASAVPAVFGSLEDADKLLEAVKRSGRKYMMFETSSFHDDCHAMRQIYRAGGFGKLVYTEGEYFHYMADADRLRTRSWRVGAAAAMVSDALERLLRGRHRRQLHRGLVHGHAQPDRASAAGEQPLQEPLRHRDRPVPHQRRRHGADGRQLGHARRRRRDGPGPRPARARCTGTTTRARRRTCPTSNVRPCRRAWRPAATAARTAT